MVEHVHYDFAGNHILAADFARSIVDATDKAVNFAPLPEAEVARRIGFPNDETISLLRKLQNMANNPPFTGQSNYADLQTFITESIEQTIELVGSPADTLMRREAVAAAGHADWKLHFEMAILSRYVRNRDAELSHYKAIFNQYPHNRETMIKIAEILSRAGNWQEVIPYLERSIYYAREDETKLSETYGWLGTAYFRTNQFEKGTAILEQLIEDYSDQIGLTLRAYGNLIKASVDRDLQGDTRRYVKDVQNYAEMLVKQGRDQEFPLLYKRMQQIMTLAGEKEQAIKWELKAKAVGR